MIRCAEAFRRDFDFLRAGFYLVGRRRVFGELTTTPENGFGVFNPPELGDNPGSLWAAAAAKYRRIPNKDRTNFPPPAEERHRSAR